MRTIRVALSLRSALLVDKITTRLSALEWAVVATPADVAVVDAGAATGPGTVAVLPSVGPVEELVRAGVTGLVLADDPVDDIVRAVHDVHRFGGWVSPRLVSCLLPGLPPVALTVREREALRLLADGRENAEIAAAMFITVSAVKYHVSNLLRKFGCRDRTQLVSRLGRPLPVCS
ncbi:regulatory protein, luxR family [Lentzea albidocapillata subsp. violacea]|uniref:Regulatory protein, luxR family n=1 Tax=Lentzea albidocapillata subsp. violacea TaxID=128104 RepID=A0A1G8QD44_9PSEU|nr:response regulator transcription factor [Lentzea albidocapillata]SDJ02365.1 regulatory protein, luxR family [Lentzea albidocapillata subsp. violacea]